MREHDDESLSTAEIAAAGPGATLERERGTNRLDEERDVRPGIDRGTPRGAMREEMAPLFSSEEAGQLRSRWEEIQIGFVDEPRQSVERADELVAQVMRRLAEVFADERKQLENQWTRGDDVSTEDLRVSLRRYRSFFDRLLAV